MIVNSKHKIFILFFLCSFLSCQDIDKTERPDDLIPEPKMIDVLTELSLVHAAKNYNKYKLEQIGIEPDNYVFEKFKIDSIQFQQSSDYYADNYVQYERIYDSVRARIQKLKIRLDSIREIEVKREDSIKQARKDSIKLMDSLKLDPIKADSLKKDSIRLIKLKELEKTKKDSLILPPVSMERN
ncbi:DUF4296 domain-containing protein [Christiangramia aquimixticola]|uniref:DUF4296 domain-containing protein n=1 Tax=Christiangramia aquimixticola TaxID=1697558 RepID=UPI003AA7BF96